MYPVMQAFPQRALRLKPGRGRVAAWLTGLGGLLFGGGIAAALAIVVAPPIWSDFQVRETAVAAREARLVAGRCRTRMLLLQDCDLTLRWSGKGSPVERQVNYLFVAPGSGNFSVQARVDPRQPALLTSDLGQEYLWNRVATASGMALIGLVIGVGLIVAARRAARDAGAVHALSGRSLQPVAAQFVGWGEGPSWIVRDEFGTAFTWPVRKRDKPMVIDPARGLVLALREAPGTPVFPLDEKLRLVDLTAGERGRILAAQAGVVANSLPG